MVSASSCPPAKLPPKKKRLMCNCQRISFERVRRSLPPKLFCCLVLARIVQGTLLGSYTKQLAPVDFLGLLCSISTACWYSKNLSLTQQLGWCSSNFVRACSVVAWLICPQLGFLFNWTQAKSQDSWQGHLRIIINHLPWHTKILEYSRKQIYIQVFIPCSHTPLTKLDFSLRDPGTELV